MPFARGQFKGLCCGFGLKALAGSGACTLAILPLLALSAWAQTPTPSSNHVDLTELPLEALMNLEVPKVYAASKVEQKTTEAPSSVSIVTADEIKKYGYRTLADILQSVQGFYVSYDRDYDYLGIRGLELGDYNNRVLLLVNGHRINENLTDNAAIGTDFILDVDLIDRVEIIRGPGSTLYGNNAFLGVINVITRQPKDINGLEASAEYGSFDSYKLRATAGKVFTNGLQFLASGTLYDDPGASHLFYKEFDTPTQNNGIAHNMDGDSYQSAFGSVNYNDFTLEAALNHRDKVNPTAQDDLTTFNDPRLQTADQRVYTALTFLHSFPEVVDVTARLYWDRYTHSIGYPQSVLAGTNLLFSAYSTEYDVGEWWGAELELNKTLWDRHLITVGGEYRDDYLQQAQVSGQAPFSRTRESHGIYVQGDFALRDNLHLDAGGRYDQYGNFSPAFDPRVALIYNPLTNSTFKGIYGTAFRAPSFQELGDPRFQNVQPEEITAYELDYEQGLARYLRSSLSLFYNKMDRLIVFNDGSFTNMNANSRGLELALEGSFPNGVRTRASYSLQQTRNTTVDWQVPDSPENMFKLSLSAPLWRDKIFAGVEVQYVSDRQTLHNTTDGTGEPITVQGTVAGGYAIVNLTLFSQKIVKNLEFSATIYNLLNRTYDDPASNFHVQDSIQQDGRTFRVKLTYHF